MTEQGPRHLFVERQTYRRRRVEDAARFLPVLGIVLTMVPLLWAEGQDGVGMSDAIRYIFVLWVGLIGAALVLALFLGQERTGEPPAPSVSVDAQETDR